MADGTLMDQEAATTNNGEGSNAKGEQGEAKADAGADKSAAGDAKADAPGDEAKGDEKPVAKAPEKYELKAGENQEFDSEFLKAYEGVAKKFDLSNEQAQELIDTVGPVIQKQQVTRIQEIRNGWIESSKADKEFGGDKLKENLAVAQSAMKEYGTPELEKFISESGLGDHPEVIRLFYKIGKTLASDSFVGGKPGDPGNSGPKTFNEIANKLYPD